jgi:hypothetical protein
LYVKGTPEKFREIFSRRAFERAIRRGCERPDLPNFQLNVIRRRRDNDTLTRMERITPDDVGRSLAEGLTVCVNDISVGDERLTFLARTIREQMSYVGQVWFNGYMSPDGSGANTHLDCAVTTTLQIEGCKKWRYSSAPVVDVPLSNAQVHADGTPEWMLPWFGSDKWDRLEKVDETAFEEAVLEPGDLLYLPAGTWHNAKAIGFSLALNMAFSPTNFLALLAQLMEPAFLPRAEWRTSPPPVYYEHVPPGHLPAEVRSYIEERIRELRRFLEALDIAGPQVDAMWRRMSGH